MRKIKVLEVIDKTFLGGGQKNLLSLAENLDKDRFEISVCSNPEGYLVEEVKRKNISHFPVSMSKRFRKEPIRAIEALLIKHGFDIIHTHGGVAGFYGRWAARKHKGLGVVHTVHGVHYLYYRNVFLRYAYIWLERFFSRFSHAVIFVSRADREKGIKLKLAPSEKIKLIENGIDFSSFKSPGMKKRAGDEIKNVPVIGTVARLHRQKNIPLLLKAGARIKKHCPGVKIFVAGGGPLQERLERLSKKLGTDDIVYFLGEREDVRELVSGFDIFVLPSLWEGLPYVLLEAAALEKPVIGTDVDGINELIENGKTGILVSPDKQDELAGAVLKLLNNKTLAQKFGSDLHKSLRERYSISIMIDKIQNLYTELFREMEKR
jgi:glycosyltransferase involved in cell wall biosynthesis